MPEQKTDCSKCGAPILQATADKHSGICKSCVNATGSDEVMEGMDIGMRIFLAFAFSLLFGGVGYAIGSIFGWRIGLIVAAPFALAGFVYGCFCVEVNSVIRSILPAALED